MAERLHLPEGITTCVFDLDGVLTQRRRSTDGFLRDWAERTAEPFEEFDGPPATTST